MMQKLASSQQLDMMFQLDDDPFEMSNLLGLNGMTAANSTIIQAEHMRCLLLDWMSRLDGPVGYYSDPEANYGQGNGDISEIRDRQSWTAIGFWTSAGDTGVLEMGKVSWTGEAFVRHDWLYMGTRIFEQTIEVSSMMFTGQDANLFSVDASTPLEFGHKACVPIRISFSSSTSLSSTPVDASLVIQWKELGTSQSANVATIQLSMADYDFEAQNLGYPPPPTIAPTISPVPTNPPTVRQTTSPLSNPTAPVVSPTSPAAANFNPSTSIADIPSTPTTSPSPTSMSDATFAPSTIQGENATMEYTLSPAMNGCGSSDCDENSTQISAGREMRQLKFFPLFAVTFMVLCFGGMPH
jgi:hypothetical protein